MNKKSQQLVRYPVQTLVIDLSPYALLLKNKMGDQFMDPPEGLYRRSKLDPIYIGTPTDCETRLKDISYLCGLFPNISRDYMMEAIQNGKLSKHIQTKPFYPYCEIYLMYHYIKMIINDELKYMPPYNFNLTNLSEEDIFRYSLKNPSHENTKTVTMIARHVFSLVDEFTMDSEWNLYQVDLDLCTVFIRKFIDFRIYDWTVQHEEKEQNFIKYKAVELPDDQED